MIQECNFRKGADIQEVVSGLGADVIGAINEGIIKDSSAVVFHNMMKSTDEIGNVARDAFDIIEYQGAYAKFRKFVNDEESKK